MSFGISNNVRSRVVRTCTPELFRGAIDSPQVAGICAEIEDALEAVKRGEMQKEDFDTLKAERKKMLPVITPHATFKNGRRLNADAVPSGLSMYDVDHIADPRGYYKSHVEGREKELGVVLAHVTPSSEGLRLVFLIENSKLKIENDKNTTGGVLAEAQHWMSEQLGNADYDGAVKDLARCSFLVPRDYILYLDENALFAERPANDPTNDPTNGTQIKQIKQITTDQNLKETTSNPRKSAPSASSACHEGAVQNNELAKPSTDNSQLFKGVSYKNIISEWLRLTGGEPQKGERNTRLHRLASHLRYITDNDENLLLAIMPRYDLTEDEMRGLIHSACSAKFCSTPKEMKQAVSLAIENEKLKIENDQSEKSLAPNSQFSILNSPLKEAPPALPGKLPALIKLLLSRTPDVYKPAVAHAVFPPLATHLHKVRFRYIDNVLHEATLMNVLMAGTGAGKDCISEPINRIMADIRKRDEENLRREREWKNEVNSKGANKDKRSRPEGLVIQEIDADMTNPAFVMRTAEANGHFLYTKLNEIDQFDALRGGSRGQQQFQIMCLSFDPGNRYGQTRVGTQSVTEKVTIRFNWNAATTILKGKHYFSRVLTDGPISRLNFCTIPEREIGAEMPVYGEYDAAFDEELRPYIDNLCRAVGEVDCPEAFRLAKKLSDECADFARLSQSRVYENLSFRANVIAYLKACVLYVANGRKWDKTMEEFVRWSLKYDLWCKMEFFGAAIDEAMIGKASDKQKRRGRTNLLELLPEEFTLADAVRVRQSEGMDAEGTRNMLWQWTYRHYITKLTINENDLKGGSRTIPTQPETYKKTDKWK